jgi:hypothetical protein
MSRGISVVLLDDHSGQPDGNPIMSPIGMPRSAVKALARHCDRVTGNPRSNGCGPAHGLETYSRTLLARFHAVRPEVQITALTRVFCLPFGPCQNPSGVRVDRIAPVIRSTRTATCPKRASRISSRSTEAPKAFTAMTNGISGLPYFPALSASRDLTASATVLQRTSGN